MQPELMVFGILSLLMGHWIIFVSKVCVKSSVLSRDFYLCAADNGIKRPSFENHLVIFNRESRNTSFSSDKNEHNREGFCPEVWHTCVSSLFLLLHFPFSLNYAILISLYNYYEDFTYKKKLIKLRDLFSICYDQEVCINHLNLSQHGLRKFLSFLYETAVIFFNILHSFLGASTVCFL